MLDVLLVFLLVFTFGVGLFAVLGMERLLRRDPRAPETPENGTWNNCYVTESTCGLCYNDCINCEEMQWDEA